MPSLFVASDLDSTPVLRLATADQDSALRVLQRLRNSPYRSLRRITCDCRQGVVTLSGRVDSFFLKQMAQAFAQGVPGVDGVVNHLQVVPPGE